ncbi:MAG: flavin reductase family protein [Akkermansiaceae bacterium]|nr:flavin reductase family protein [Akkermansiaceae bacterium]
MQKKEFTELQLNPAELIGKQWMLITAGTQESFNTMTASWGGLGYLWNRPVAFVFVRPNRHTASFIDAQAAFTLSFMPEKYRNDLLFCGRNSGRDVDKMAATSLEPFTTPNGLVAMADADLVLECRKMAVATMQEADFVNFAEVSPQWYDPTNPLHKVYICEITTTYVR